MAEGESGFRTLIGESQEGSQTTRSAALAQIAFERVGLFAAVFGFALLLIKIMRVSHLNSRTGHALISTVGPIEIILGALVTHFPTVLFIVAALVTWWATGSFASARKFTPGHVAAAGVVLFALILLPWPFVVALLVIGVVRFVMARSRPPTTRRYSPYYVLIGAIAILLITDAQPWLAPERFQLKGEPEVLGYALEEAQNSIGWVVVLVEEDRSVIRLRQDSIAARHPCHEPGADVQLEHYASLFQVAIGESSELPEPECP